MGPIFKSESGNHYILTVSDYFSKWVVHVATLNSAFATPKAYAVGVANALFKANINA